MSCLLLCAFESARWTVGGKDRACYFHTLTIHHCQLAKPHKVCLHRNNNLTFKTFKNCVADVCICLTGFELGTMAVFEKAYYYTNIFT